MARGRGGTRRGGRGRGASRGGRGGTSVTENNEASTSNPVNVVSDSDNDEESDNNDIANLNGDENGWTDNSGDNDGEGGSNQDNRRIRIVGIPDPPTLDNDSDDSGSDVDGEAPRRAPRTGRRLLLKNKAINCLEEAFNPVNYDRIEMPTGGDRKEVSALLTPKKTRPEVTITFRNYKVNNAGRPPR